MAANLGGQLPHGWEARWDQNYGRYYFVNHATQSTTWIDPRLNYTAQVRPVEQIPMQEFRAWQPAASGQSSAAPQPSATAQKETGFQYAMESTNVDDDDDEDEEWRNALLLSSMQTSSQKKHLLFHEKVNMKEKFKREFKVLDSHVVESTIEKHDYDEDIARAMLESLKDAEIEKQRKKREEEERKRREKEQEEKRKALEKQKAIDRIWMKKELREKKEAEQKAALESERRRATVAASQASRATSTTTSTFQTRKIMEQKTTAKAIVNRPSTTVVTRLNVTLQKNMKKENQENQAALKRMPRQKAVERKPAYVSPNRLQPAGPQASLRQGPSTHHLGRHSSNASGANKALVSGPQTTNRKGPSMRQPKISLSKGPQASLRQGPQCRLAHGRSLIAGQPSPIVSAVKTDCDILMQLELFTEQLRHLERFEPCNFDQVIHLVASARSRFKPDEF